ncbi:MAG TPA: LPS export ABC transporter periplasmic protein LptC, partial [Allocoleopsis sp.]
KLDSVDPPIEITGNSILWNLTTKMINSDQPATIFQIKQNLKLTANNSVVDLEKQIAYLTNGVEGFGGKNKSQISSKDLTWFMKNQEFIAMGNVNYSQLNPPFNLTGVRAVGKLQGDQIIVRGEAKQRVITNIIP